MPGIYVVIYRIFYTKDGAIDMAQVITSSCHSLDTHPCLINILSHDDHHIDYRIAGNYTAIGILVIFVNWADVKMLRSDVLIRDIVLHQQHA